MDAQSGRVEKRLPVSVPMWLTSFNRPGPFERAVCENISPAGARIIVGTRWPADEPIVVVCSPGCIANGHVVYSQPLPHDCNQFALGVRLQNVPRGWPVPAGDVP
jgi:hypothetical protein